MNVIAARRPSRLLLGPAPCNLHRGGLRISSLTEQFPELRRPEDFAKFAETQRSAGLPE